MKSLNRYINISVSAAAILFFLTGCHGKAGFTGESTHKLNHHGLTSSPHVLVIDGYVEAATVTSFNNQSKATDNGNGSYTFAVVPSYPIIAEGGTITPTGVVYSGTMFTAVGSVISPITTIFTELDKNDSPTATTDFDGLRDIIDIYSSVSPAFTIEDLTGNFLSSKHSDAIEIAKLAQALNIGVISIDFREKFLDRVRDNTESKGYKTIKKLLAYSIDEVGPNEVVAETVLALLERIDNYNGSVSGLEEYLKTLKSEFALMSETQAATERILLPGTENTLPGDVDRVIAHAEYLDSIGYGDYYDHLSRRLEESYVLTLD